MAMIVKLEPEVEYTAIANLKFSVWVPLAEESHAHAPHVLFPFREGCLFSRSGWLGQAAHPLAMAIAPHRRPAGILVLTAG